MVPDIMIEAKTFIEQEVIPLVNAFRSLQETNGSITGESETAKALLKRLTRVVRTTYRLVNAPEHCTDAFQADVEQWLARGLDTVPQFDLSLESYSTPRPGTLTFFVAPLMLTNGLSPRGAFLECFLAYREEPLILSDLDRIFHKQTYPLLKRQSCRLLAGSDGWLKGNCYVFFPENVATSQKVSSQAFALSFSNKFRPIFLAITLPRARTVFGTQEWRSEQLSAADFYQVHTMWSYLHDYFHQCGPRPLDENLQVKMNFFAGTLEEIKVDSQAVAACYEKNIPFGREISEFIIGERVLRYPYHPNATSNFDAAAGLVLFKWLLQQERGLHETSQGLNIEIVECPEVMALLAEKIEVLEITSDDAEYRRLAREFVRTFLDEGVNGARFSIPGSYLRWVYNRPAPTRVPDFVGSLH